MIALFLALALAAPPAPKASAIGIGAQSCEIWMASGGESASHSEDRRRFLAWAEGHASAAAALLDIDLLSRLNEPGLTAWLDNYCRTHSAQSFATALLALEDELAKIAGSPPPSPASK